MRKAKKSIVALSAFFVAAAGISACGGGIPSNSVAEVAGNPISTQAFNHWMYVAAKGQASQTPGSPVIVPSDPPQFNACVAQVRSQIPSLSKLSTATVRKDCKTLFTSLSSQVMDFLIKAYWYQADAKKLGISVSNADVQKAFAAAKKQQFPTAAQFQAFLKSTGQTLQDITYRVRINQIYMKLLKRYSTAVTPAAIQAYYTAHASQFGTPASASLHFVRTKTLAQANAAKKALEAGQSWTVVAKKYSQDAATKNNGGTLNGVTKGEEEAPFSNAIFAAKVNKVVGPIKGQFGYYVFEVTKIKTATQQSLAQATAQIKSVLTQSGQQAAATKLDAQAKKNWYKQTSCRSTYAMDDCNGFKPPKTTSTTPTTPAPAQTTTAPSTTTTTSSTTTSSSTKK